MTPQPPKRVCPICGKAVDPRYKPFCSARCANVDLARWLGEVYRMPAGIEPDEDEDGVPPPVNDND